MIFERISCRDTIKADLLEFMEKYLKVMTCLTVYVENKEGKIVPSYKIVQFGLALAQDNTFIDVPNTLITKIFFPEHKGLVEAGDEGFSQIDIKGDVEFNTIEIGDLFDYESVMSRIIKGVTITI